MSLDKKSLVLTFGPFWTSISPVISLLGIFSSVIYDLKFFLKYVFVYS